jgi:hypothetical protein
MPIAEAIKGQIALLYVVRAWLLNTPGDMAKELSRQLSQEQLDYTVSKFFRTSRTNAQRVQATEHLDIATRIVPFGRVALLKVTDLLVTGSFGHDGALLTAARAATIESSPGRIKIDVGELIAAMRHMGRTPVDPTDAMVVIEGLIADTRQHSLLVALRRQPKGRHRLKTLRRPNVHGAGVKEARRQKCQPARPPCAHG